MSGITHGTAGLLVLLLAAACSARLPPTDGAVDPSDAATSTSPPVERPLRFGEPIEPGAAPTAKDCDGRLRSDMAAALAIRESLGTRGVDASAFAVERTAGDPTADLSVLGIPLLPGEIQAMRESGLAWEPGDALVMWVHSGRQDLFGGVWIDPPGSQELVVSIVGGDPSTLALAQCLEGGVQVRYVVALISHAEGQARQAMVVSQIAELQALGIQFTSVSYKENEGLIEIGLLEVTPEAVAELRRRFGDDVRVIQQGPIVPL